MGFVAAACCVLTPALLMSSSKARPANSWSVQIAHELASAVTRPAPSGIRKNEFYFTRAIYSSGGMRGFGRRRGGSWDTDYPKADNQFLSVLGRLARELDSNPNDHAMELDDPELRKFPFVYAVEVGYMGLSDREVTSLRDFLLAGGFLIVDDFWGTYEWANFEENIRRVLPEYDIVDLPMSHPIFHAYYQIEKVLQVPSISRGCGGGPYYERDGYVPAVKAIFNERGRMLVLISWNSDLGDAWEWMEQACYPLQMSTYAYQIAVNTIVYAMSH
ncbi:MAG: DUF4159 domain-containing protein, partial [Longimicrobiales bacterium]